MERHAGDRGCGRSEREQRRGTSMEGRYGGIPSNSVGGARWRVRPGGGVVGGTCGQGLASLVGDTRGRRPGAAVSAVPAPAISGPGGRPMPKVSPDRWRVRPEGRHCHGDDCDGLPAEPRPARREVRDGAGPRRARRKEVRVPAAPQVPSPVGAGPRPHGVPAAPGRDAAVGAGRPKARCATPGVAGDRSLSAGPGLSVRGGGRSPATGQATRVGSAAGYAVVRRTGRR